MKKLLIANLFYLLLNTPAISEELCTASTLTCTDDMGNCTLNNQSIKIDTVAIRSNNSNNVVWDETINDLTIIPPDAESGYFLLGALASYNGRFCYCKITSPFQTNWFYLGTADTIQCNSSYCKTILNQNSTDSLSQTIKSQIMNNLKEVRYTTIQGTCPTVGYKNISIPFAATMDTCTGTTPKKLGTNNFYIPDTPNECKKIYGSTDSSCISFATQTIPEDTKCSDTSGEYEYTNNCYLFNDSIELAPDNNCPIIPEN